MPFPREIHSVSVVGAGLMGRSIAALHLAHGVPVTVADVSREVALESAAKILDEVRRHSGGGKNPLPRSVAAGLIQVAESDEQIAQADLVIEALPEQLRLKRKVLSRLATFFGEKTIVATNTSSLAVGEIAAELPKLEQVCGLHFCHPVEDRALVEVVRIGETSDETLFCVEKLMQRVGKQPLAVADRPGFLVNRLLWPYLNEGLQLLHDGVEAGTIEEAACRAGFPWGPLTQLDEIGIDTALRVGAALRKAYPDRVGESQLLVELFEARRFGRKCGQGILCDPEWAADDPPTKTSQLPRVAWRGTVGTRGPFTRNNAAGHSACREDRSLPPSVREIVARHAAVRADMRTEEIVARLKLSILLEAARIVGEHVADAEQIDTAIVEGLRFFEEQRGVLRWADSVGMPAIIVRLRELIRFGDRFGLPASFTRMAANARRFHAVDSSKARHAA